MAEANISRQSLLDAIARLELQQETARDDEPLAQALRTALEALRARLARLPAAPSPNTQAEPGVLTALVADLSGYTALSEQMDAERVREALNAMWRELDAVLLAWGGDIDQHAGDSVVALFGRPLPRPHDPVRAAHAALALQMELDLFNRRARDLAGEALSGGAASSSWAASWPSPAMRVGLDMGPVYFVDGGPGNRATAAGEAIRVARALEECAPSGGVLISAALQAQLQGQFVTRPMEDAASNGRWMSPEPSYLLLRERPEVGFVRPGSAQPRLVGRAGDLDRLEVAFQQAADSASLQVVTVAGQPGSGKARLVAEFETRLRLFSGEAEILHSRGERPPLAAPHEVLRGLMARRFGIRPQHSRRVVEEKVRRGLVGRGISLPERDVETLAAVATMSRDTPAVDDVVRAARRLLASLVTAAPVLIIVESVQNADPDSLAMINALVDEPAGLPVLILTTLDTVLPDEQPAEQPDAEWLLPSPDPFAPKARIDLVPLSPVESRLLATDILSPLSPPPMRLVDLVVAEAGGNPLYVEELVRYFIDAGIVRPGARWSVDMAAAETVRLPRTLRQMLRMRLDHLPEAERLVLGQASVMGDVFWDRGLSVLRPLGEGDPGDVLLDEVLGRLEARGLIRPEPSLAFGDALAHRFGRLLLRDVAYESLYAPQRREAHRQIASWLVEWREQGKLGEWFSPAGMLAWAAQQQAVSPSSTGAS